MARFPRAILLWRAPPAKPAGERLGKTMAGVRRYTSTFNQMNDQESGMQQKTVLTADDVKKIMAAAETEAKNHHWAVSIVVVDDGGHLLAMQRLDGAAPISAYIAGEKARTSALGRRESKIYEDMINNGRYSFMTAPVLQGMLEGGVPIVCNDQVVGAVGVSGVKSTEDAQIARAGIAALGL